MTTETDRSSKMNNESHHDAGPGRVWPADTRGRTELSWLHARHSFSFGRYFDPQRASYRSLRVLNDDVFEPGGGFGEHGHDNMEIITWVLEGELAHADSTGQQGVIRPGDAQVMSAGSGIRHSEVNGSDTQPVHLLQIWITPNVRDVEPRYGQKHFDIEGRRNRWQRLASPDGRDGSMVIHQDAHLSVADLDEGQSLEAGVHEGRGGYLHVASGVVMVGNKRLEAGDALSVEGETALHIEAISASQLLWFDLA